MHLLSLRAERRHSAQALLVAHHHTTTSHSPLAGIACASQACGHLPRMLPRCLLELHGFRFFCASPSLEDAIAIHRIDLQTRNCWRLMFMSPLPSIRSSYRSWHWKIMHPERCRSRWTGQPTGSERPRGGRPSFAKLAIAGIRTRWTWFRWRYTHTERLTSIVPQGSCAPDFHACGHDPCAPTRRT